MADTEQSTEQFSCYIEEQRKRSEELRKEYESLLEQTGLNKNIMAKMKASYPSENIVELSDNDKIELRKHLKGDDALLVAILKVAEGKGSKEDKEGKKVRNVSSSFQKI